MRRRQATKMLTTQNVYRDMAKATGKMLGLINGLHLYRRHMIALGRRNDDVRVLAGDFDSAMQNLLTAFRKVERIVEKLGNE